jgi:hypothetical protein
MERNNMRTKQLGQRALLNLIARDAQLLLDRWGREFVTTHGREPTGRELNKAVRQIIDTLNT